MVAMKTAVKTNASNIQTRKVICKCNCVHVTSNIYIHRHAPATHHPKAHGLKKPADKGDWTTNGRIIPTIDFSCWVLQKETVGLSGQDPSALSLTKRVFSGLIRQKAHYQQSQPPPQLDKGKAWPPLCSHWWFGCMALLRTSNTYPALLKAKIMSIYSPPMY